ncbi:MAG: helix-turn-helix domain-containing protein [Pseudomonadota bacterium]
MHTASLSTAALTASMAFNAENPHAALIREQRQLKHYVNVTTAELDHLYDNKNLKLHHHGLATYLIRLVHNKPNQSVLVPIQFLADKFQCSRHTIARYLKVLATEGYIVYATNHRDNSTEVQLSAPKTLRDAWANESNRRGKENSLYSSASAPANQNLTPPTITTAAAATPAPPPEPTPAPEEKAEAAPEPQTCNELTPDNQDNFDFAQMPTSIRDTPLPAWLSVPLDTPIVLQEIGSKTTYRTYIANIIGVAAAMQDRRQKLCALYGSEATNNPELCLKLVAGYPSPLPAADTGICHTLLAVGGPSKQTCAGQSAAQP